MTADNTPALGGESIECTIEGVDYLCNYFSFSADSDGPCVRVHLLGYDRVGYRGKRHVNIRYLGRVAVVGDYFLVDSRLDGDIMKLKLRDR